MTFQLSGYLCSGCSCQGVRFHFSPKMKSPFAKASVAKTTGHEAFRNALVKRLIGSRSRRAKG